MMTGIINASLEIVVCLRVLDSTSQEHEVETILDTGFNASLTLPSDTIAKLGLIRWSTSKAILADGSVHDCNVFAATVIWDGQPRSIVVQEIDSDSLLGMQLLLKHDLNVRVVIGGVARLTPIP